MLRPIRFEMSESDPVGSVITGWGAAERWGGKWSTGQQAITGFRVKTISESLILQARLRTLCSDQKIDIWCNGRRLGWWPLRATDGFVTHSVHLDGEILRWTPRVNTLVLHSQNLCQSPKVKEQGIEGRSLGFACDWIQLSPHR